MTLAAAPLRIFFFESTFDGTVGGSHSCMFNLIKNMDRSKFDFTVGFRQDNLFVQRFRELGIEVHIFPRNPVEKGARIVRKAVNWYRLKWRFHKQLEKFFKEHRFHLVVNNNSIWTALDFVNACEKFQIPLIAYERGYGGFRNVHLEATAGLSASIPISRYLETKLIEHGFKSSRIRMIYDGINPADIRTDRDPADIKRQLKIPESAKVLGVIGNIRPWKGQRFFVEAFNVLAQRNPDLYGLVVGSSKGEAENERYYREIQQLVDPPLKGSRLIFLDFHEKITEILSILDVLVHTSIKPEPFGMVLLEAIAAKTPVIATNMGGPLEILDQGVGGLLVPARDAGSIVAACSRLLENPALREELVQSGFERLSSCFHIRSTIDETSKLFIEIAEGESSFLSPPPKFNC